MSTRRSAASRRAELKRRAVASRESAGPADVSDAAMGITVRRIQPGGGRERLQVRWNVGRDPTDLLIELVQLRTGVLAGLEVEAVAELRSQGYAWEFIGHLLGVTGEAARLRFRDQVEH